MLVDAVYSGVISMVATNPNTSAASTIPPITHRLRFRISHSARKSISNPPRATSSSKTASPPASTGTRETEDTLSIVTKPPLTNLNSEILEYVQERRGLEEIAEHPFDLVEPDHDHVTAQHLRIGHTPFADRLHVEHRARPLAVDVAEDHHLVELRYLGRALCLCQRSEQGRRAVDRINPRLLHITFDREVLRHRRCHRYRYLRVDQILLRQRRRDVARYLCRGLAPGMHRSDQRKGQITGCVHLNLIEAQVFLLKHRHSQYVQRTDPVRRRLLRRIRRRHHSIGCHPMRQIPRRMHPAARRTRQHQPGGDQHPPNRHHPTTPSDRRPGRSTPTRPSKPANIPVTTAKDRLRSG